MSRKNDSVKRCFHDGNLGKSSRLITRKRASTVLGACLVVLVVIFLSACPSPGEEEPKEEAKVTGITLSTTDANFIKLDKTLTLSVEVTGTGDYDKSVTWSSSSDTIAVVENGTVTGKSVGTVTITATSVADTSVSGSIKLEVKANYVGTVTIDGGNLELGVGIKKILAATVAVEGTLSDAEKTITWSSDKPEIASIDADSGELEAKAEGTAQIRATAGGVNSAPITITVIDTTGTFKLPIDFTKFDSSGDENTNIHTHFIDTENYDSSKPLLYKLTVALPDGVTVDPPLLDARNYSDLEADIFTVTEGSKSYKFRLNIIRKPIIITQTPKANTDYATYAASGAPSRSLVKFVQTDYFYTPTMNADDTATDNPAPTFALFAKDANPSETQILGSSVKILRNFTSSDGTTLFFPSYDDLVDDDDWPADQNNGLNANADLLTGLAPSTEYSLHWAMDASNGRFSGSLGTVTTAEMPSSGTGFEHVYFGWGGMEFHKTTSFRLPMLLYLAGVQMVGFSLKENAESITLANITGVNPGFRLASNHSEYNRESTNKERLSIVVEDPLYLNGTTFAAIVTTAHKTDADYSKTSKFE